MPSAHRENPAVGMPTSDEMLEPHPAPRTLMVFPNPFEKYARQNENLPQFSGWKKKMFETTTQQQIEHSLLFHVPAQSGQGIDEKSEAEVVCGSPVHATSDERKLCNFDWHWHQRRTDS